MSRKDQRVPYRIDPGGVKHLDAKELTAILRGADAMIHRGGRTQLSLLLKGSRQANVIEHGLDRNPSYGFYKDLAVDEILRRIDFVIDEEYLAIVYDYRLPVIVFTKRGWAIEAATMATELFNGLDERLTAGPPYDLSDLKDGNREMIFLLLDKIEGSWRHDLIPLLKAWSAIDYAKVRARIANVLRSLEGKSPQPGEG